MNVCKVQGESLIMKQYTVQIMEPEPEQTMGLRQLPIDNFSVFYVIEGNSVVVMRVTKFSR